MAGVKSGPSDKAVEATARDMWRQQHGSKPDPRVHIGGTEDRARRLLTEAHDPALGLDRSVCLRDVVEALDRWDHGYGRDAAEFIEREFGRGL